MGAHRRHSSASALATVSRAPLIELKGALGGTGVDISEIPRKLEPEPKTRPSEPPAQGAPAKAPKPAAAVAAVEAAAPSSVAIASAPATPPAAPPPRGDVGTIKAVAQTVRVDIHKLDYLMNIVGELAIVCTSLERVSFSDAAGAWPCRVTRSRRRLLGR